MLALSLTQPWATLVAIGAKKIETRSFQRSYRGPLAIHAAEGLGPVGGKKGLLSLIETAPFRSVLVDAGGYAGAIPMPFGAIVAVCELVDCVPTANTGKPGGPLTTWRSGEHWWLLTDQERAFGDYSPGRYAWLLTNIRALPEPIPAKGALGLWELDPVIEQAVTQQLATFAPTRGQEG